MAKNSKLRKAWKRYECNRDLMRSISFGDDTILVAPEGVEAWEALYSVMESHGYHVRVDDTDSYNCRNIKGTSKKSLHSYGIALDVNWHTNPWRDHKGTRSVKYSNAGSQEERGRAVKLGRADTDMTPSMIAAIRKIRTKTGKRVFTWGGDWTSVKDAMHFELALTPDELDTGIDWATVAGNREGGSTSDNPFDDIAPFDSDDFEDVEAVTLGMGDSGPLVSALQESLTNLGYWLGKIDGKFGRMTRDALMAFQADNGVEPTGRYDAETREALDDGPEHRPVDFSRNDDTEKDLIARGSQTMRSARWNRWLGLGTIALGLLGVSDKHINFIQSAANAVRGGSGTIEGATAPTEFMKGLLETVVQKSENGTQINVDEVVEKVSAAFRDGANIVPNEHTGGILDSVLNLSQGLLSANGFGIWPLVAGAGYMIWRNARSTSDRRLRDHKSGANRGR